MIGLLFGMTAWESAAAVFVLVAAIVFVGGLKGAGVLGIAEDGHLVDGPAGGRDHRLHRSGPHARFRHRLPVLPLVSA